MIKDVNQQMDDERQLDDCMDDTEEDIEIIENEDIEDLDASDEEADEDFVDESTQVFSGHEKA
ncbi:unnamed protein product, partial [Oppiella nova]